MVHLNKILNPGLFGMEEKIEDSTVKEIILDETFIKVNGNEVLIHGWLP